MTWSEANGLVAVWQARFLATGYFLRPAEPSLLTRNAGVEIRPAMNPQDLGQAGPTIEAATKKYAYLFRTGKPKTSWRDCLLARTF